jgi:hypothetical protein
VHIRSCDEGALVFDERNGKTSLLNLQSAKILGVLISHGGRFPDKAQLWAECNPCADSQFLDFESSLASLQESGLILH